MLRILRSFLKRTYEPLNRIEISTAHLWHNYHYLTGIDRNLKIAPVLKSNAYGHGIKLIAHCLDRFNLPFFCVDSLYEAYELLKVRVKTPILIMGTIHPHSVRTKGLPFSYAVYTKELLRALNAYQPHAKIHLFVDTGMHREGISFNELPEFLRYIKSNTSLSVDGLMSHFGESNEPKSPFTKKQVIQFQQVQDIVHSFGFHPQWIHIANSSALLHHTEFKGELGNLVRCGIALYGIDPEGKNPNLQPVLELKTQITQVKQLRKGESIGYDFTYTAPKNMTIGVLPIGYHDGIDRRLSNIGYVSVNGKNCQIVGRVSMNITTVGISSVSNTHIGQEVIVYSNQPKRNNSIQQGAIIAKTIPYDLLVRLSSTTKRVLV
jgi:alanine racemase